MNMDCFRVTKSSKTNLMDTKNLAICWWPTLLRFEFDDLIKFQTIQPHLEKTVQTMIEQYQFLFCSPEEVLQELIEVLIEWINDELRRDRIIVQNIGDLCDGQVLQKLMEKLTSETLNAPEVTQSEDRQREKLRFEF